MIAGCNKITKIETVEEYLSWLNTEKNGLLKTRYINGFKISVKYLPQDYIVYQELDKEKSISEENADSLLKKYEKSLTFIMTIGPDEREREGGDIMFQGVKNYKEYKERFYDLNFDIENKVALKTMKNTYNPALAAVENIYGLNPGRNIILVFVPTDIDQEDFYSSQKIDLVFDDDLFDTGISHFVFKRTDINNIPEFNFLSNN